MHRVTFSSITACIGGLILLSGCQASTSAIETRRAGATIEVEEEPAWRKVATPEDAALLDRLPALWTEALGDAQRGGFRRQVSSEGALLDPNAALPRAAPAPGSYTCRVLKLGAAAPRVRPFTAFKPFFCHVGVNDDRLSITKQTGSQRPGGYLWETEDSRRLVFLGAVARGNEEEVLPYGEAGGRNVAGMFERFGDFRYRLVIPSTDGQSKLEILELTALPPRE